MGRRALTKKQKVLKGNTSDIVAAGIRALYGKQKYAYKYSAV